MKYVYIVRTGADKYKVGIANNVTSRVKTLQTGNAHPIRLVCTALVDDEYVIEGNLHQMMSEYRSDGGKEWFTLRADQAIELCIALNSHHGASVADFVLERLRQQIDGVIDGYANASRQARAFVRSGNGPVGDDELIARAQVIFAEEGRVSTSLLQRRLKVGYQRAARVVDAIRERDGGRAIEHSPSTIDVA